MSIRLPIITAVIAATLLLPSCSTAKITAQQAQDIALQEAGTTADTVQYLTVTPDREDGKLYYNVSFIKDGAEYEYEIDVKTSKVVSVDIDAPQT